MMNAPSRGPNLGAIVLLCLPLGCGEAAPSTGGHDARSTPEAPGKFGPGWQDRDGDGQCKLACSGTLICGLHGQCDDSSGEVQCACDAPYTGAVCQHCANGYQERNGKCVATCESLGVDCGGHGACDDSAGVIACLCDAGYQDDDGDNVCEPSGADQAPPVTDPPSTVDPSDHRYRMNDLTKSAADYPGLDASKFVKYDPLADLPGSTFIDSPRDVAGGSYILENGTYSDFSIVVSNAVLRAETLGGVVCTGRCSVTLEDGGVLDGFTFRDAEPMEQGMIEIAKGRVTRCSFINITGGAEGERIRVIQGRGAYAIVDHNDFRNICTSSLTMELSLAPSITYRNRFIGHCDDYTAEIWRIGSSGSHTEHANAFLEENYWEDQNGEHEMVSIKASGITVRGNTVLDSQGAITNRYGNDNVISDNYYVCSSKSAGGIRSFGKNHRIHNNYVKSCDGDQYGIALGVGTDCDGDSSSCAYVISDNIELTNNTLDGSNLGFGTAGKNGSCPKNIHASGNEVDSVRTDNGCQAYPGDGGAGSTAKPLSPNETGPFE